MMPASDAKYTLMIPQKDNLGNPLGDIATAAHQWLWQATGNEGSYIEAPRRGNWRDDPQELFDPLVAVAEDTPEMDSHVKQLAMEIARGANQWGVFVTKESGGHIQKWTIDNPHYVPHQPAEIAGLVQQQSAQDSPFLNSGPVISAVVKKYQQQSYYDTFFHS